MSTADPTNVGERIWAEESRFPRRASLVGVDRLTTTGTVRIRAQVVDDQPFEFKPGQFVTIREDVPGVGQEHSPYCLFAPQHDDRTFELLIRVFPEGPLSQHLASLPEGSTLHFRGPSGRSMLPKEPETDLVLLATGVGISPYHSLFHELLRSGDRRRIRLYWGLRLVDDICLTDDLDQLTADLPDFRYAISLSQPPAEWTGLRGRLTSTVPGLLEKLGGTRFYLAGNGAMAEEFEIALSDQGVDRSLIHQERFFNARHVADQSTLDAMNARFVAHDLFSPLAESQAPLLFHIERDVHGRRVGD